jgi:hypothetical protein
MTRTRSYTSPARSRWEDAWTTVRRARPHVKHWRNYETSGYQHWKGLRARRTNGLRRIVFGKSTRWRRKSVSHESSGECSLRTVGNSTSSPRSFFWRGSSAAGHSQLHRLSYTRKQRPKQDTRADLRLLDSAVLGRSKRGPSRQVRAICYGPQSVWNA